MTTPVGAKTMNTMQKKNTGRKEQNYSFPSGCIWPEYSSLPLWHMNFHQRLGSERVWSDWCSERSEAGQMLVVTDTQDEMEHNGPIAFGEDTESLQAPARLWTTVEHYRHTLLHRHCLLPSAKLLPTSTRGGPSISCLLDQYTHRTGRHAWGAWGIDNSLFAFSWSDSCNIPVREARTPNVLVVSHLNSHSTMH